MTDLSVAQLFTSNIPLSYILVFSWLRHCSLMIPPWSFSEPIYSEKPTISTAARSPVYCTESMFCSWIWDGFLLNNKKHYLNFSIMSKPANHLANTFLTSNCWLKMENLSHMICLFLPLPRALSIFDRPMWYLSLFQLCLVWWSQLSVHNVRRHSCLVFPR